MANHIDYYREQLKQMLPLPEQEVKFYEWAIWSSLMETNAFLALDEEIQDEYNKLIKKSKKSKKSKK